MRTSQKVGGIFFVLCLLASAAGWYTIAKSSEGKPKLLVLGGSVSNGPFRTSSGTLAVIPSEPGLFFGTVHPPAEEERFSYLIIFQYDSAATAPNHHGLKANSSSDGRSSETNDALIVGGKEVEFGYTLQLDENHTRTKRETLKISGQDFDLSAGRLFLIDFKSNPPNPQQISAALPPPPTGIKDPPELEPVARNLLKDLESRDPAVRSFVEAAR